MSGASPLRLYGPNSIVHVICPVKAFRKTVDDAILKNLLPLTYKNGDYQIKEKSSWHIEVQGLLHVTGIRRRINVSVHVSINLLQEGAVATW